MPRRPKVPLPPDPNRMTTAEVCELLGISRTTLWRYVRSGLYPDLPAPDTTPGADTLWPRAAMLAFAEKHGLKK